MTLRVLVHGWRRAEWNEDGAVYFGRMGWLAPVSEYRSLPPAAGRGETP